MKHLLLFLLFFAFVMDCFSQTFILPPEGVTRQPINFGNGEGAVVVPNDVTSSVAPDVVNIGQEPMTVCGFQPGQSYAITLNSDGNHAQMINPMTGEIMTNFLLVAAADCVNFEFIAPPDVTGTILSIGILSGDNNKSNKMMTPLNVIGGLTPYDYLVQGLFGGSPCGAITNVTTRGSLSQIGAFNNATSSIGLADGLIISSGAATGAIGPNNTTSFTTVLSWSPSSPPDPDLAAIMGVTQYDLSVIEFDYTPTNSYLNFEYSFGSDCYEEWSGSWYNDGSGIFITGMGNIATVPSTPISSTCVNCVNNLPFSNPTFYTTNLPVSGTSAANLNLQYDGFTNLQQKTVNFTPGVTYHIKIAIADGSDPLWDSGFFAKASCCAPPVVFAPEYETVCIGDQVNLDTKCTGATVVWEENGIPLPFTTPAIWHQPTLIPLSTYTAKCYDAGGCLLSVHTFIVTTVYPILVCPADVTVCNDIGSCDALVYGISPIFPNGCSGLIQFSTSGASTVIGFGDASGVLFNLGTTTVTYDLYVGGLLYQSCSFMVTVEDCEPPEIICPSNVLDCNDPGVCGAVVWGLTPIITDNCGLGSINLFDILPPNGLGFSGTGDASGLFFDVGTSNIKYTVTDFAGNTSTCSFMITITDCEAPFFTCADKSTCNTVGLCSANVSLTAPVITDNCPGPITFSTSATSSVFPVGTTIVTNTATDAAGNTYSCTFKVTVKDCELPTISCPANKVVCNTAGLCNATVALPAPIGSDNCPGVITTSSATSGIFPVGTHTIFYKAIDLAGNTKSCSFTVKVNDCEKPTIVCPVNMTINNTPGLCSGVVTGLVIPVADNCCISTSQYKIGTGPWVNGSLNGQLFNVGLYTLYCRVLDCNGNFSTTCTFKLTVKDSELPKFSFCPPNITVAPPAGLCTAIVPGLNPLLTDNCCLLPLNPLKYKTTGATVTPLTNGNATGKPFNIGVTTVTYQLSDCNGNIATCIFKVTVIDPCMTAAPAGLTTTSITTTTATLSWNVALCALSYEYQWRRISPPATAWSAPIASPTNTAPLAGLASLKQYQWRVRAKCTTGFSAWSAAIGFVTPLLGEPTSRESGESDNQVEENQPKEPVLDEETLYSVSPNPTMSSVLIFSSSTIENDKYSISIFGSLGEQVKTSSILLDEYTWEIDLSEYPTGIYFIRINIEGKSPVTKKVMKL
jgi:HYR domain/Secretion system C-terminal sorting domain